MRVKARTMSSRGGRLCLSATLLLLCASASGGAGRGASSDEREGRGLADLSEVVDVHLVSIDLLAFDRKGRPLTGLKRSDFRLLDNGKRVEVTHFSHGAALGSPNAERLTLIVFVDNLHLSPANRDATVPALRTFFAENMGGDRVHAMVVAFDGRLRMLQDLTADPGQLALGLSQIELLEPSRTESRTLKRLAQATVEETLELLQGQADQVSAGRASMKGAFGQLSLYARSLHKDTLASVEALATLVDSLALVPGRKAILYVGDGMPLRPLDLVVEQMDLRMHGSSQFDHHELMRGPDEGHHLDSPGVQSTGIRGLDNSRFISQSAEQDFGDLGLRRFSQTVAGFETTPWFHRLVGQANTNRVTFYPVRPPPAEAADATLGERTADSQSLKQLSDLHSSLRFLAAETGGLAMVSGKDVPGFLKRAARDFAQSYSIGFAPTFFVEGSLHRVDLSIKHRGARLRYRKSYVAKSMRNRVVERTSGALLLGWVDNPQEISLHEVKQVTGLGGLYNVELAVMVPLGRLELVRDGDVYSGQIRIVVAVLTEAREQLEPTHIAIPMRIPATEWQEASGQLYSVNVKFDLPRGTHKVAAGLWDENAGQGSFIRKNLVVRGDS